MMKNFIFYSLLLSIVFLSLVFFMPPPKKNQAENKNTANPQSNWITCVQDPHSNCVEINLDQVNNITYPRSGVNAGKSRIETAGRQYKIIECLEGKLEEGRKCSPLPDLK